MLPSVRSMRAASLAAAILVGSAPFTAAHAAAAHPHAAGAQAGTQGRPDRREVLRRPREIRSAAVRDRQRRQPLRRPDRHGDRSQGAQALPGREPRFPEAAAGDRPRPTFRQGEAELRHPGRRDPGPARPRALPGAPAAAEPLRQRAEQPGQLRQRHRLAAAGDPGAVPRLPEPPGAAAGLDRPGHRQHEGGHADRRGAAEDRHDADAAAVPAAAQQRSAGQRVLFAGQAPAGRFADKDKRALEAGYRQAAVKIGLALDRLCAFLEKDYLPAGRSTAGYGALPDGAAWYQARIRNNTNLDTPPAQIHDWA
jgi:hypothetical protein